MSNSDPQHSTPPESEYSEPIRLAGLCIVLAAVSMQLWAVLHAEPLQSANDRSRWATVWSLVERGTWAIDEIDKVPEWSTIDKVRHRSDESEPWHFYSSKPPLLSTIVAGLYWLERHTVGYDLRQHPALVSRWLLVLINVIPMWLALLSFRRSLSVLKVAPRATLVLLVVAGFATMLNPFLTTLNNHTPAAVCLVFCLAAMIRISAHPEPHAPDYFITGFMAALTCCFELPAALFGVISFLFVVTRDWRHTAKFYVPAALVPLAAFFITNFLVTGGIKPFYAYYGTEKYVYVHEGVPSYWSEPQGIDANSESTLIYLFHCLLGHHGILSITPIFVLTVIGWWLGIRSATLRQRKPVQMIGASLSVIVLAFYLAQTRNYNYGGNSAALRWMLWLIPFWWYGMIPAVERLTQSAKGFAVIALLLVPSIWSMAWSMQQPWRPGWIYTQMEQRGWIDYRTRVPPFNPPRYSVISNQPDVTGLNAAWKGSGSASGSTFQILTLAPIDLDGDNVRPWDVRLTTGSGEVVQHATIVVSENGLASGQDVSHIVRSLPSTMPSRETPVAFAHLPPTEPWIVEFLRGLPAPRPYNSASPRYLKYRNPDGEVTAVKCVRGASRVAYVDAEHGRCWQRCDVFYCDEVPFGVAQWMITVTTAATNTVVKHEIWTSQNLP
ncbi:MAG: hypothetical protein R3C59_00780 [Planctomycetaceae bacterium]